MSGASFYAVSVEAMRGALGANILTIDDVMSYLDANAHVLPNGAHHPCPLDDLLELDALLDAAGVPAALRYCALLLGAPPVAFRAHDAIPLIGFVRCKDLIGAADARALECLPSPTTEWQRAALDELFHCAGLAATLQRDLVGVYL